MHNGERVRLRSETTREPVPGEHLLEAADHHSPSQFVQTATLHGSADHALGEVHAVDGAGERC
jgi:hypothetical protein